MLAAALLALAVTCSSNAQQDGACRNDGLWVSSWSPYSPPPHWMRVTLARGTEPRVPVGAISYTMRQDGGTNGTLRSFRIDCDGVQVVMGESGIAQLPRQSAVRLADLGGRECREVTLRFLETWGGAGPATWASAGALTIGGVGVPVVECAIEPGRTPTPMLGWRVVDESAIDGVKLYRRAVGGPWVLAATLRCWTWTDADGVTNRTCPRGAAVQRYTDVECAVVEWMVRSYRGGVESGDSNVVSIMMTAIWRASMARVP